MCVEQGEEGHQLRLAPRRNEESPPDGKISDGSGSVGPDELLQFHGNLHVDRCMVQGDGKVYIPIKGPWSGMYAADACAMVVAEEMGAKMEDVILSDDPKALFTPVGGGSLMAPPLRLGCARRNWPLPAGNCSWK